MKMIHKSEAYKRGQKIAKNRLKSIAKTARGKGNIWCPWESFILDNIYRNIILKELNPKDLADFEKGYKSEILDFSKGIGKYKI